MKTICLVFIVLSLTASTAAAYWPTTPEEQLIVREDDNLYSNYDERAIPYPNGKTLFLWNEGPIGGDDYHIWYNIVNPYGEYVFPEHQVLENSDIFSMKEAVSDGAGGAVLVYNNIYTGLSDAYIYLQHLDSLGNKLWGSPGRQVAYLADEIDFELKDLIRDPTSGDYYVLYKEYYERDLMCQRLDADGYPIWPGNGCVVADSSYNNYFACPEYQTGLAPDLAGGVYAVWRGTYPNNDYNTYAQHLDSGGNRLWFDPVYGKVLTLYPDSYYPEIISDGEGGCIVYDNHTVKRLNFDGNTLWESYDIGSGSTYFFRGDRNDFYATSASSGWYAYAQRFSVNGELYWPASRVQLYTSLVYIGFSRYGAFFHNGYLFCVAINSPTKKWVLGQKVDREGNLLWGDNGIGVAHMLEPNGDYIANRGICTDQAGGMVAMFQNAAHRQLYAKRILSDGTLGGDGMAPIEDAVITLEGSDVHLNWPPRAGAGRYNIYISVTPYSFPHEPSAVTADTFYLDPGAAADAVRFYEIRWEVSD